MLKLVLPAALLAALCAGGAFAQKKKEEPPAEPPVIVEEKPAPYDGKIMRLAEILGSVHYLRNLCNDSESEWRQMMESLLAEETKGEPQRAARFTAAFNRGYRSFASTYVRCTQQAIAAEEKYRAEGATLATEITARFGN